MVKTKKKTAKKKATKKKVTKKKAARKKKPEPTHHETCLAFNKNAIMTALKDQKISEVKVQWYGSGDDGQVDGAEITKGPEKASLETNVEVYESIGTWQGTEFSKESTLKIKSLALAIESMVDDWLDGTHGGWENNEGGNGEAIFDVKTGTIEFTHNTCYQEYETDVETL